MKHDKNSGAVCWHSDRSERFSKNYARKASFRERKHAWLTLVGQLPGRKGAALDLGCGSGELTIPISKTFKTVTAIDASEQMLKLSKRNAESNGIANVTFRCADIRDLATLKVGTFDFIYASSVLEYLEELDSVLHSVSSRLNAGGIFSASLPNKHSWFRRLEPTMFRILGRPRYYQFVKSLKYPRELEKMAVRHGLKPISVHYFASDPIVGTLLSKLGFEKVVNRMFLVTFQLSPS